MNNNFKSFDEDEIPDGLRKVLEQLQKEGTDVSVVRLNSNNKNKTNKKFNDIMSKLQYDDEDRKRKIKEALSISEETLQDDIKDMDDDTLFKMLNQSYVDLVKKVGRPVTLAISLVLTEDGSLQMCTGGLETKEDVITAFETITKQLKKHKHDMRGDKL